MAYLTVKDYENIEDAVERDLSDPGQIHFILNEMDADDTDAFCTLLVLLCDNDKDALCRVLMLLLERVARKMETRCAKDAKAKAGRDDAGDSDDELRRIASIFLDGAPMHYAGLAAEAGREL